MKLEDTLTIGWMLSVMTTLFFEAGALVAQWFAAAHKDFDRAGAMADVVLFTAAVVGLFALVMTPIVLKIRKVPPPRGITIFAVAVGFAPLLTLLVLSLVKQ